MGYYVEVVAGEVIIPKRNLTKAYKAMCELNKKHDLKRGGRYGFGEGKAPLYYERTEPDKKGKTNGIQSRWFSWMDYDYDRTCKTADEIIDQLGFFTDTDEKGNLHVIGYDEKTGQEDLFFKAIAPYVLQKSYLDWMGEDGSTYRWTFKGGQFKSVNGEVVFPE